MGLHTFKGGVHPVEGKDLSKDKPIKELLPKGELAYLVSQHIGAPAKPVVSAGDTVLRGQLLAEAGGFVSAPIFSSVSGTVKKIEKRRTATGDMMDAIIVENDGEYKEVEFDEVEDYTVLSNEEILQKVKDAGVVGMGGAGFPTHVKLAPKEPDKIDYIIANCAECEPYLTCDYRLMMEYPEKLIEGMKIYTAPEIESALKIAGFSDVKTYHHVYPAVWGDAGVFANHLRQMPGRYVQLVGIIGHLAILTVIAVAQHIDELPDYIGTLQRHHFIAVNSVLHIVDIVIESLKNHYHTLPVEVVIGHLQPALQLHELPEA